MISLPVGAAILAFVLIAGVEGMNLGSVVNSHAILIVAVGTLGALAMSTPMNQIKSLMRCLVGLFRHEVPLEKMQAQLIEINQNRAAEGSHAHPLIRYAQSLWQEGVDDELFKSLLQGKLAEINTRTAQAAATMRNLAKYPPALGMTGTVVGLVSIFSRLSPDSRQTLGPSLALAMTATFYGLVIANALLLPLADRLTVLHHQHTKVNDGVFRVLMLIHRGEPTQIIEGQFHAGNH